MAKKKKNVSGNIGKAFVSVKKKVKSKKNPFGSKK